MTDIYKDFDLYEAREQILDGLGNADGDDEWDAIYDYITCEVLQTPKELDIDIAVSRLNKEQVTRVIAYMLKLGIEFGALDCAYGEDVTEAQIIEYIERKDNK